MRQFNYQLQIVTRDQNVFWLNHLKHQFVLPRGFLRCRIPDDCIDSKRYPLFMAREVMRQLIDNLCVTTAVHQGALS